MDTSLFFDYYFKNAQVNSILIMDSAGVVVHLNSGQLCLDEYHRAAP